MCVRPEWERASSAWSFYVRYITLPLVVWLTVATINALWDGDTRGARLYVYYGLAPSAVRVIAAMWSSTIDRQIAKDLEQDCGCVSSALEVLREGLGLPTGTRVRRKGASGILSGLGATAVVAGTRRVSDFAETPRRLFRRYLFWSNLLERPLNYGFQKISLAIIIGLFFWPRLFRGSIEVSVGARWVRIITTVLLAPLNHWLGHLREKACLEIERELVASYAKEVAECKQGKEHALALSASILGAMKAFAAREVASAEKDLQALIGAPGDVRRSSNTALDRYREVAKWANSVHKAARMLEEALG
jgi:hypothetical protein